ncbi:alpha/beta hydrolase [Mucilaginibacter sp. PAMB04168]|uniref:alpha/beta hydrolase family protein n=1 Tax=Mucilaginibacter sp. PAMB04168 TaxID=3138567 RepID=UPI0031F69152
MKRALLTCLLVSFFSYCFAQGIVGDWYGTLKVGDTGIPLVFHIVRAGKTYTSTMDSPNQGAKGLQTGSTTFLNNQLVIDAAQYGIKYTGAYLADSSKINGTFSQGGMQLPLVLANKQQAAVTALPARMQDPKDFPYKQEQVAFESPKAGAKLAGTLTLPADGKVSKVVVLISGSGPQNRNEEITQYNHRPFLVWSDWLTRQGIAVLRYDDRGVAESTGNFQTATSADFADDAEAAVTYLQSRPDMAGVKIGLVGHSEGGLIAPMVASRNEAVKFIVLLAGPGVPITELMAQQTADLTRQAGASEKMAKMNAATNERLYNAVKNNPNLPKKELEVKLAAVLNEEWKKYPSNALGKAKLQDIIDASIKTVTTPWFRYFLGMDPIQYLKKVKCPVLALNGTLDMQVNSEANLASIRSSLQKAGNTHHQEVPMPQMNHFFQKVKTGSTDEYGKTEETVNPLVLQKVSDWIKATR